MDIKSRMDLLLMDFLFQQAKHPGETANIAVDHTCKEVKVPAQGLDVLRTVSGA